MNATLSDILQEHCIDYKIITQSANSNSLVSLCIAYFYTQSKWIWNL